MFSSPLLDTLISLILVYGLLSIVASVILEAWNHFVKQRGVFLQQTIFRLLDDPLNFNLGYLIYQHPSINRLRKGGNSLPNYLSAEAFCNALIETIADQSDKLSFTLSSVGKYIKDEDHSQKSLSERFIEGVKQMRDSEMKLLYKNFIDRCNEKEGLNLEKLRIELSHWYNDYMDRVTGEYKAMNRPRLIFIGLVVAFFLNIDTFHLTHVFYNDKDLRESVMKDATAVAQQARDSNFIYNSQNNSLILKSLQDPNIPLDSTAKKNLIQNLRTKLLETQQMDSTSMDNLSMVFQTFNRWNLPLGYNSQDAPFSWFNKDKVSIKGKGLNPIQNAAIDYYEERNTFSFMNALTWLVGVILSGFALGFGAPFWFELLVKFINIRSAGIKPLSNIIKNNTSV